MTSHQPNFLFLQQLACGKSGCCQVFGKKCPRWKRPLLVWLKAVYSLGSSLGRLYCHRKQPVIATDSRKKKMANTWIHFTSITMNLRRPRLLDSCYKEKRYLRVKERGKWSLMHASEVKGTLHQTITLLQGHGLIPVLLWHLAWHSRPRCNYCNL